MNKLGAGLVGNSTAAKAPCEIESTGWVREQRAYMAAQGRLGAAIEQLEERLAKALKVGPDNQPEAVRGGNPHNQCEIANEIERSSRSIHEMADKVESILDRLDI